MDKDAPTQSSTNIPTTNQNPVLISEYIFQENSFFEYITQDIEHALSDRQSWKAKHFCNFLGFLTAMDRFRHWDYKSCYYAMSKNTICSIMGRKNYLLFCKGKHPIFNRYLEQSYKGNNIEKRCSAYRLTKPFKHVYKEFQIARKEEIIDLGLYSIKDKQFKKVDKKEISLEPEYDLVSKCQIYLGRLYYSHIEDPDERETFEINARVIQEMASWYGGYVPQYYNKKSCGRYYVKPTAYTPNIQTTFREVKAFLLSEQYRYDIWCCIFTFLVQEYEKNFTDKLSHLRKYMEHRKVYRKEFASLLGIPEDIVKGMFIGLGCGMNIKANVNGFIKNMMKEFGYHKDMAESEKETLEKEALHLQYKLHNNTHFKEINSDIEKLYKLVEKRKDLARLYMKYESKSMEVFMKYLTDNRKEMQMLIHDEITTLEPVDIDEIEALIQTELDGFEVKFDIQYPYGKSSEASA